MKLPRHEASRKSPAIVGEHGRRAPRRERGEEVGGKTPPLPRARVGAPHYRIENGVGMKVMANTKAATTAKIFLPVLSGS
jgi:hypothetical protein